MKKLLASLALVLCIVYASPVSAQYNYGAQGFTACSSLTSTGFNGISNCIVGVLNDVVVILIAGAVVFTVWGAFNMVYSEEKRDNGKMMAIYGVIGIFVMVSIWGFVNILDSTFRLSGGGPISPPPLVLPFGQTTHSSCAQGQTNC